MMGAGGNNAQILHNCLSKQRERIDKALLAFGTKWVFLYE